MIRISLLQALKTILVPISSKNEICILKMRVTSFNTSLGLLFVSIEKKTKEKEKKKKYLNGKIEIIECILMHTNSSEILFFFF